MREIAEQASTNPISIAPASPMNIRAGLKLCGRIPTHTPASAAQSMAAAMALVSTVLGDEDEGVR